MVLLKYAPPLIEAVLLIKVQFSTTVYSPLIHNPPPLLETVLLIKVQFKIKKYLALPVIYTPPPFTAVLLIKVQFLNEE